MKKATQTDGFQIVSDYWFNMLIINYLPIHKINVAVYQRDST